MLGHGDIHFLDDKLDFNVRLNMKGPGVLLTPVYKLFEYTGDRELEEAGLAPEEILDFRLRLKRMSVTRARNRTDSNNRQSITILLARTCRSLVACRCRFSALVRSGAPPCKFS